MGKLCRQPNRITYITRTRASCNRTWLVTSARTIMRGAYLIESITNVVDNDLPPLSRLGAAKSARFAYKLFILFGLNKFHNVRNSDRAFVQQIRIKRLPASPADIPFTVIFTGALLSFHALPQRIYRFRANPKTARSGFSAAFCQP